MRASQGNSSGKVITLLTDFGTKDWFVGTMKGVIANIAPRTQVIDVTHEVPAGDIRAGAFALASSRSYFPRGTIHVAVVDPGVGSGRKAIAVETGTAIFIGPDNGVLSWALRNEAIVQIRSLESDRYHLKPASRTFHGRDIFAPVAAHISRGVAIEALGAAQTDFVRIAWPEPRSGNHEIRGQILYIDRFGNAITNIDTKIMRIAKAPLTVFRAGKRLCHVGNFYQAVGTGRAVAVPGSSGFLEIAINGGNAARQLKLSVNDTIALRSA